MKIENNHEAAYVSKNVKTYQATISMTPEVFDMMIKGIYSDEVAAPARELICNARDSHVEAGVNTPIKIHAPTPLEPWFSVQDFGLGMSEEMVTVTYMCLGTSTKRESNELIGAKGIGSKSPFALVDAFQVCSVYDGIQTSYSVYKDKGLPMVAPLHQKKTDAQNGVEVKFAVDPCLIGSFQDKLTKFLTFFDYPYELNVEAPNKIAAAFETYYEGFKVIIPQSSSREYDKVVMGGVPYRSKLLESSRDDRFIVEIPIGSCDVDPGREWTVENHAAQSFVDKLRSAVEFAQDQYEQKVRREVDSYTKITDCTDWYKALSHSGKMIANDVIYREFDFRQTKMMRYYPACSRGESETPNISSLLSGKTVFMLRDKSNCVMQRAKSLMEQHNSRECFVVPVNSKIAQHPMLAGLVFNASDVVLAKDPKPKEKQENKVREKGHRVFVLDKSGISEWRLTKNDISKVETWVTRSEAYAMNQGQLSSVHTQLFGTLGSKTNLSEMLDYHGLDRIHLLTERQAQWANPNGIFTISVPKGLENTLMQEYLDVETYNELVGDINQMRSLHGMLGRLKEIEIKKAPSWIPRNILNRFSSAKKLSSKASAKRKALDNLYEQTKEILMQNYPLLQQVNEVDWSDEAVKEYIFSIKKFKG